MVHFGTYLKSPSDKSRHRKTPESKGHSYLSVTLYIEPCGEFYSYCACFKYEPKCCDENEFDKIQKQFEIVRGVIST